MGSPRIRRGDTVQVIAGKDIGRRGRVLRVLPDSDRVHVEQIQQIVRHTRANQARGDQGGRLEREGSIHISNLKLVCPACDRPTRVKVLKEAEQRIRVCKACGEPIKEPV